MINSVKDLILAVNSRWLENCLESRQDTRVRVYLNGRYVIEEVEISKDDGAIVLWLDERGDPDD